MAVLELLDMLTHNTFYLDKQKNLTATFFLCCTPFPSSNVLLVEGPVLANHGSYMQHPEKSPALPRGHQFAIFSQHLADVFNQRWVNVER